MNSNKTFLEHYISNEVAKKTSDLKKIDDITCNIIYDLIANYVVLPAHRLSLKEIK